MSTNRPFFVLDTETDPFEYGFFPEPFIWGVYGPHVSRGGSVHHSAREFRTFDREEELIRWIRKVDGIFYAHNGGRFDILFLAEYLSPGRISLINDRIVKAKIGHAELRDSWPLIPLAQAKFGKDTSFDYKKLKREVRENHRGEIRAYLESDCRSLYAMLESFFREHPRKPLTLASTGMAALRRIEGLDFDRVDERWDASFRPFYHGGRVEARIPGDHTERRGTLEHVDINSAYPFAMTHSHWWGADCIHLQARTRTGHVRLPRSRDKLHASMVEVVARSRGALPHIHGPEEESASPGALSFPADDRLRRYWATGWEIAAGLETDTLHIERVNSVFVPSQTRSFARFVQHYHERKQEAERAGDTNARTIAKLIMNGCYGKFAQNPRNFLDWRILRKGACPPLSKHPHSIPIGEDRVAIGEPPAVQRFYNVATAASITGFVRAMLWAAIVASEKSGPVYYCDTDSLIAKAPMVNRGNELGQWKHEAHVKRIAVAGKKLYAYWDEKGVGHSASKGAKLSPAEIARLCRGEEIEWKNDAPTMNFRLGRRFVKRTIRATAKGN